MTTYYKQSKLLETVAFELRQEAHSDKPLVAVTATKLFNLVRWAAIVEENKTFEIKLTAAVRSLEKYHAEMARTTRDKLLTALNVVRATSKVA